MSAAAERCDCSTPRATERVDPSVLTPLLVVIGVGAISVWVLEDARSRAERRQTVVATFGGLTIDRPEVRAPLCLLVVVPLPLYLVARDAE